VSQKVKTGAVPENLQQLLYALVVRFKSHGVTSAARQKFGRG
jgi:hypothetical protein